MSISHTLKVLKDLLVFTDVDKRFCELSRKKWSEVNNTDCDGIILIDFMAFEPYLTQSFYTTNYFKKNYNLDIRYFHFLPRNKYILRLFFKLFRRISRFHRLYKSFGCDFGLSNVFDKQSIKMSDSIKFTSKKELENFSIEGIQIGLDL